MSIYTRAMITALLTGASAIGATAGPLPINMTMEKTAAGVAVEVRWSGQPRHGWGRGPRAPIDGAIIGGPIAANAFGPYGYGYPYYPSYSCYGFWLFEECYSRFHWSYRR